MGRETPVVVDERKVLEKPWYNLTTQEVIKTIDISLQKGLDPKEAKKRLMNFGSNEIETETGLTRWQILLHQFKDPLIYIFLAVAFVTFVLQDIQDIALAFEPGELGILKRKPRPPKEGILPVG